MAVPVSDLQQIAPSAIIELFELELNTLQHGVADTYRFHAGANLNSNGEVVWAGNSYLRFPIEADGFEYSGNGQLPRPKVRVSNIMGTITSLLLSLPEGLEGAKFTRIRTLARYLDGANFPGSINPYGTPDPTAEFPREIYYVDRKTVETRDVVEFELAAAFDLAGIRAPKRQCIGNICQWKYRSAECGYTGPPVADANDKPVASYGTSALAQSFGTADAALKASAAALVTAQTNLATATNVLNAAKETYVLLEDRYNAANRFEIQGTFFAGVGTTSYVGLWDNESVAPSQTYRVGSTVGGGDYRIQRWGPNPNTATEQAAYNAALATYNAAQSDYNTKKTARNNALTAWQASPTYQSELAATGDVCGKRLSSCRLRFTDEFGNESDLPYGSYPGIGTYFT